MADLVSGNLKEEKILTRFNRCTRVALGLDTQPVESIEQEAQPGVPSSTFGGKGAQTESPRMSPPTPSNRTATYEAALKKLKKAS